MSIEQKTIDIFHNKYVGKIVDIPNIGRRGIITDILLDNFKIKCVILWDTDLPFTNVPFDNHDDRTEDLSVKESVQIINLVELKDYIQYDNI